MRLSIRAFGLVGIWVVLRVGFTLSGVAQTVDFEVENTDDVDQLETDGLITEEAALILREMLENPIDLNRANLSELMAIPSVSRADAEAILDWRERRNGFAGWKDLSELRQLSAAQLRTLRAFAEIRPRVDRFDGRLWFDVLETGDDGDPYYSRLRIRSNYANRFFLGVVVEREDDIAYQWANDSPEPVYPGWRLDKLYLEGSPGGVWKQVVAGNFTAGFASGLTFNDAHRSSPRGVYADDTTSSFRQRGIAAAWEVNRWSGAVFASVSDYPVTLPAAVTGFSSQRQVNRVYDERLIGASAAFRVGRNAQVGGVGYQSWIDKRVDVEFRNLPNRDRWAAAGLYASAEIAPLDFRGEVAQSLEAGWGGYLEAAIRTQPLFLLASLRRYAPNFDNPHSHGFADSDDTTTGDVDGDIDEVGVFLETRCRPHQRVRFRAYYDQWEHPSRLQSDNEAYAEVELRPADLLELGVSGKWSDNEVGVEGDERRSGLLWFVVQPHRTLYVTPVYRRSAHKTLSGTTDDDYVYLKVEWFLRKQVEWEARWKTSDTAWIDGDTFPKEFYIQVQLWDLQGISGRVRYTRSRFGADSTAKPNLQHKVFARIEYEW